jgi:hypothetical protein
MASILARRPRRRYHIFLLETAADANVTIV